MYLALILKNREDFIVGFRLVLYLAILIFGAFIGFKGLASEKIHRRMNLIQTLCLLFLLFVMGIRIGVDKDVISSFGKLGYQAVVISIFSIGLSVVLVKSIRKYIVSETKEGRVTDEH